MSFRTNKYSQVAEERERRAEEKKTKDEKRAKKVLELEKKRKEDEDKVVVIKEEPFEVEAAVAAVAGGDDTVMEYTPGEETEREEILAAKKVEVESEDDETVELTEELLEETFERKCPYLHCCSHWSLQKPFLCTLPGPFQDLLTLPLHSPVHIQTVHTASVTRHSVQCTGGWTEIR